MKLETLSLKNFGSYREATIDLRDVAAAVVTGSNGAGKSTGFVDAPLAALFGRCRVSLDDIMALGTDDMVLTLTFALNGQRYRVIRKRSKKTKAGKSELALQIAQGDTWEDASGARLQDTQEKICTLLNADYDLLTATGFLLQGQADRFSRATPTERKAILAQILRLDQYGPLKQAANRHATITETQLDERREQGRALTATAETVPSLEARQGELTTALTQSQQAIERLEQHQQELTAKKATLAAELGHLEAIPAQMASLTTARAELVSSQQAKLTRQDRATKILANRATIEAKVLAGTAAQAVEADLEAERLALAGEATELGKALSDVRIQLSEGMSLEKGLVAAKAEVDRQVQRYVHETQTLDADLAKSRNAVAFLSQVPCGVELQRQCQFTLQAVQIEASLPDREQAFQARHTADEHELIAPEACAAWHVLLARQMDWEQHGYAQRAAHLESQLQAVSATQNDCERRRAAVRFQLSELAKFTVLVPELAAAERELVSVEQDLAQLATERARIEQELGQLAARQSDRDRLTSEHADAVASLQQDTIYLAKLRTDSQAAGGRLKELDLEIMQAQEAARQALDLQQALARLQSDRQHFQALATAYTQIPVLILETAIPLLEDEANRILGQISPSGMRVRLETQKTLKSRDGLAETLDIVVRDVYGERPYENYSGGEKFRLDLALRIGLSKLLAHRAGAKLETLIIDEGLGSLDEDGLAQLRECLATLQSEFPLVLVITHVEAMKHTFPSQLVISKDADGSHVELVA